LPAPVNNTPLSNTPVNPTEPANNTATTATVQPFNNGVTESPAPTPENGVKTNEEGLTFKVQIGAYRKQVPQATANNWMKVKTWPIKWTLTGDLYIYTVGSFSEPSFARQLRQEIMSYGITDAFVVVFKDGKRLSFAEAAPYINR
jgi:cell division septation protein DedD